MITNWTELLSNDQNPNLRPPGSPIALSVVEATFRTRLDPQHRSFLVFSDGGQIANRAVLLYCSERGGFSGEDLYRSNQRHMTEDDGVFAFGRDAHGNEYCFRLDEMKSDEGFCAVYFYDHETFTQEHIALSFTAFIERALQESR